MIEIAFPAERRALRLPPVATEKGPACIVNAISGDDETTWFEGLLLVCVYLLLALAFYFTGSSG